MFTAETRAEWKVEDGTFTSDRGFEVSPCSVECEVILETRGPIKLSKEVNGTLRFPPDEVDESVFLDQRNVPKKHNVTVENEQKELVLEGLLVAPGNSPEPLDFEKVDFLAMDATLTVEEP